MKLWHILLLIFSTFCFSAVGVHTTHHLGCFPWQAAAGFLHVALPPAWFIPTCATAQHLFFFGLGLHLKEFILPVPAPTIDVSLAKFLLSTCVHLLRCDWFFSRRRFYPRVLHQVMHTSILLNKVATKYIVQHKYLCVQVLLRKT